MENHEKPAFTVLDPNGSFWEAGLSKLEYACIKLGIPETGDKVIDDLIVKSERKKLIALAMQSFIDAEARSKVIPSPYRIAQSAVKFVDEFIIRTSESTN